MWRRQAGHTLMKLSCGVAGLMLISALTLLGADTPSVAPTNDPNLRPVTITDAAEPPPATFQIAVSWNAKAKDALSVPLMNDSSNVWQVLGVQSSAGIFIQDFPNRIKPGEAGAVDFIYDSREDTDSSAEIIRVKTDGGIRTMVVQVQREAAVTLDTHEVHWKVGEALVTKTITLTIVAGTVTPQNLKSNGGASAVLETIDSTHYRISITPKSTAKTDHFQVAVKFDKPLPGVATKVFGSIDD